MSVLAFTSAESRQTTPSRPLRRAAARAGLRRPAAVLIRTSFIVALGASAASAQPVRRSEPAATTSVAAGLATPGAGGPFCIAECPRDTNPCDPADFKRADGRCDIGSN